MSIRSNKVRVGTVGITVAAMSLAALPAHAAGPTAAAAGPTVGVGPTALAGGTPTGEASPSSAGTGQTTKSAGRQSASKQENIGVITGLAVGAAAGGPIGAFVGVAAGAWLGDRYHRQIAARHMLAADLSRSERERRVLDGKLSRLADSLAASQAKRAELARTVALSDEIEMDIAFRTDDVSITRLDVPVVRKLGALAASLPPGATVRVDGYADPRGSDALNDDLSLRRAEAVALLLVKAGCPQDRLVVEGHGSSQSTSRLGDLDSYAFDRRVTVRLEGPVVAQGRSGESGHPALVARQNVPGSAAGAVGRGD